MESAAAANPGIVRLAVVLASATALSPLAVDMYLPALPLLQRDFGVSSAAAQQTLAIFLFGMAATQFFVGPISDSVGRKRPMLIGIAAFVLASAGCALASTIGQFSLLRLVQALGGAAGAVLGRAVARDYFEGPALARLFSMIALVMGLAPVLAPLMGTAVLLLAPWRSIFWVLSAFGIATFLLIALSLRESLRRGPGPARGMAEPFIAMRVMVRSRSFMGHAIAVSFSWAALFCYIAASPFVFIVHHGLPPSTFAWIFGLNGLGLMAASQLNLRLLRRYSPSTLLRAALMLEMATALLLMVMAITGFAGAAGLEAVLFVFVFCCGLVSPNANALAMGPYARAAGAAAALIGVLQGSAGGAASGLVGSLPGRGAVPMATMILIVVGSAFVAGVFVARPPAKA